jgi:hypothetical protein
MSALAQIAQEKEAIAQQFRAEKQSRSKQALDSNSHSYPLTFGPRATKDLRCV